MSRIDMTRRTALYRLFDKEKRLLYVGIAFNPDDRWAGHASSKSWWVDVVEKSIEWHDSRTLAMAAELKAISAELPLYNKKDSPRPYDRGTTKPGTMPSRVIRIDDDTWRDFKAACAEEGTTPSSAMRRHVHRRLMQHRAEQRAGNIDS